MVYVDQLFGLESSNPEARRVGKRHDHKWCHMWADDVDELIKFAMSIGMKRDWLQNEFGKYPHYDLVPSLRIKALKKGAEESSLKKWLKNK